MGGAGVCFPEGDNSVPRGVTILNGFNAPDKAALANQEFTMDGSGQTEGH
jgi:hypothetical protein